MTNKYWKLPENWRELRNAVTWAAGDELSLEIEAPLYVVAELLEQKEQGELLLHLVNFNVVREPAVGDIEVSLRIPANMNVNEVSLLSPEDETSRIVPFQTAGYRIRFTVPELKAYALLVIQ